MSASPVMRGQTDTGSQDQSASVQETYRSANAAEGTSIMLVGTSRRDIAPRRIALIIASVGILGAGGALYTWYAPQAQNPAPARPAGRQAVPVSVAVAARR